jgi:hypothetical protein
MVLAPGPCHPQRELDTEPENETKRFSEMTTLGQMVTHQNVNQYCDLP